MKKVVTLAGSNSKTSINQQLIDYTVTLLPGIEEIPINLNDYDLPIYGVDYEAENGIPTMATELYTIFQEADGFVISLAEHNGSYTAVFKNVIDWLSRIKQTFCNQKPLLLMSTSPGGRGGKTVLQSAVTTFPFLGAEVVGSFAFPGFYEHFSEGQIQEASLKAEHSDQVAAFIKDLG
ncbi:MAG: NAD(P)H-dependent oxidoreductase [Saprospiraceae bacterium]|nr:NAD(P)H-dependent oxidoreductase [Saprospiraceae bacterium]